MARADVGDAMTPTRTEIQLRAARLGGLIAPACQSLAGGSCSRRRIAASLVATLAIAGAVAIVLAGRRGEFRTALLTAPVWMLAFAAVLHLASLVTRGEAWGFCVRAAGGSVSRRVVFRAAGLGSLATVLSAQLGVVTRIGALRRTAPQHAPRIPALLAAEVPIIAIEATLAALFAFTLVRPLALPPWLPALVLAGALAALLGLRRLARRRRSGVWLGLAALAQLRGRGRLLALVLAGILAQIARNWLVLRAVGVHPSIFDAIAVLIVSVALSPVPIGAGVGATASVLILGAHGVAATAAAGILLTATGTVAALCFASWACMDHLVAARRDGVRIALAAAPPAALSG